MKIVKVNDYEEMSIHAANVIQKQIKSKPNSVIVFPTGSTPEMMYSILVESYSEGKDDWSKVIAFNLDEYVGLPRANEHSYYSFMHVNLYDNVNIAPENIHMPNGEGNIEQNITTFISEFSKAGKPDLVILGIGQNGHIGFNEPGTSLNSTFGLIDLSKSTIRANSKNFNSKDEVPKQAISMGIIDILSAKKILLLASGRTKADALNKMINEKISEDCPASFLRNNKDVIVIIDNSAGIYV